MKLYRLEETPWQWQVCCFNDHCWKAIHKYQDSRKSLEKWKENISERADLNLVGNSPTKGFLYSYYLVREPWPEEIKVCGSCKREINY